MPRHGSDVEQWLQSRFREFSFPPFHGNGLKTNGQQASTPVTLLHLIAAQPRAEEFQYSVQGDSRGMPVLVHKIPC